MESFSEGAGDANELDDYGRTSLHNAVNEKEVLGLLLVAGAKVGIQDVNEEMVRMSRARIGFVQALETLLDAGANCEIGNNYHAVPPHLEILRPENAEAAQVLLAKCAKSDKSPSDVQGVHGKGYHVITTLVPAIQFDS